MWRSAAILVLVLAARTAHADDVGTLAAKGADLQEAGEWMQARAVYEQLEKVKGQEARAVYLQAFAAAQAGAYGDALALAQRASGLAGPYHDQARMLYADVLARQGDLRRAKDFYVALHKVTSGDTQLIVAARLAAVNSQLKLLPTDGIAPPAKLPADSKTVTVANARAIGPGARADAKTDATVDDAKADGPTVYRAARDAFDRRDLERALKLAQRATMLPGPHKLDAKILYADTLFLMGDFKRARDLYIGLHKAAARPQERTTIAKKVALANAKLGLAADDGIAP